MINYLDNNNWTTCCRGSGGCPKVALVNDGETLIVLIKDDNGNSVKMTKEQFDSVVEIISSKCE